MDRAIWKASNMALIFQPVAVRRHIDIDMGVYGDGTGTGTGTGTIPYYLCL